MITKLDLDKNTDIAIVGHAGVGHAHSHNNFVQDDSVGLAAVLTLIQEAYDVSFVIEDVDVRPGIDGTITVTTVDGGVGHVKPRRGITLYEKSLCQSVVGKEAIRSQAIVVEAFGRMYGQGVTEVPVSLQAAVCNAALDTLIKKFPESFMEVKEDVPGNIGKMVGTKLNINEVYVSILGVVNATEGGIGPNEDLEGGTPAGSKGELMEKLGMIDVPTIVLEGKVYSPSLSDDVDHSYFLVRADDQSDNPVVAQAIKDAADKLGYAIQYRSDVLARSETAMGISTRNLASRIKELANQLYNAEYSDQKVKILAELSQVVSQDAGGVTFMSNKLHTVVGGVGMAPGTSAVMSLIVPGSYKEKYVMPLITEGELSNYTEIIKESVLELSKNIEKARTHINQYKYKGDINTLTNIEGE